ncbi:MAG: hypothetical protein IPP94_05450 [Ignavibacteria bacterium]|nr:hypothetical protein [Ignavibacteria bacterium]
MTGLQLNQLSMYRSLAEFLAGHSDIIAGIEILPTIVAEFNANLTAIEREAQTQGRVTAGKTDVKLDAEERLSAMMILIAEVLYAYATRTGNLETLAKASMSRWRLRRLRDSELSMQARIFLEEASAHSTGMARFGIGDAVLLKYREAIAAFEDALEARNGSLAHRKVTRSDLRALFDATDRMLEDQLDGLMGHFRDSHPSFHETYRALRVVRSNPARRRSTETEHVSAAGSGYGKSVTHALVAEPSHDVDAAPSPAVEAEPGAVIP